MVAAFALFVASGGGVRAWDPDAGLVPPLAAGVRTVAVTSNEGASGGVIDGNDQTMWQSGACFPSGFIGRKDLNALLNRCSLAPSACAASSGSSSLASAVDNSFYTGATIKASSGQAFLAISLPNPVDIFRIGIKGAWGTGFAKVLLGTAEGGAFTAVEGLNSSINWQDLYFPGLWRGISWVQVISNDTFTLTEVAAQFTRCYEMATVDMQAAYSVNVIRARWWAGGCALSTQLLRSEDGVSWTKVADVDPAALPSTDFFFDNPVQVRYIRVRHEVNETGVWKKVYVWELAAYGAGGRWGPPPFAAPQTRSFRQLLGVNGIWGFGNGSFSDSLAKLGKGPLLYSPVASSGRNYQSVNWDVKKLGNDPKWDTMSKTGTDGQWWLDWDREYRAWKTSGLPVAVTYQFISKNQPPAAWGDAYNVSFTLGFKFARHFGKTYGTGNVDSFEVGNEPWDYNATFYSTLLSGFLDGLSAGDPTLKRLPCALQANEPLGEGPKGGNYIGARVNESVAPQLDALNIHIYSFFTTAAGVRIGVHPEHPGSSMNGLHNFQRWRDANMPGTPVWVTEWGWDARRPGEDCGATTECVSQLAQAAYGVRGLALLARKGVEQTHWFFYGNGDDCNTLFCRSGLRDTKAAGFADLPVYRAFYAFMQLAGASLFQFSIQENDTAYVYLLGNQAGVPTHLLAWRPVAVGEAEDPSDRLAVQFRVAVAVAPVTAWSLSGAAPAGSTAAALPAVLGQLWSMELSGIPTLVVLRAAL